MKNKRFIITLMVCITLVITFVLLTSYAYWRISKTQTGTNDIKGACLSIRLDEELDENNNPIKGFTLENAWPVTDSEGLNQNGYNFKVINTCEEAVTYQLVLDRLPLEDTNKEINSEHIKVAMDNGLIKKYGLLEDATTDDIEYEAKESKVVFTGQIPGKRNDINGEVEHNIKIWISEDSDNDDIGKQFSSRVRVIAGQGLPHPEYAITPGECFEFDENTGTITGYDEENCTTDYLVVPQKIDGVMVKSIDFFGDSTEVSECLDCRIKWNYIDLTNATGLKSIGEIAFRDYVGTEQRLVIPNAVEIIGDHAFLHYKGEKLTLSNNLKTLGYAAFYNYIGANQELVIPGSVEEMANSVFLRFNGSKLIISDGVKNISEGAFYDYVGTNEDLAIPGSVDSIAKGAFRNYKGEKLTLNDGIKTIDENAFHDYVGTDQELVIPDSVQTVEMGAFSQFNGTKLTIGKGINTIAPFAFGSYQGQIDVNMNEEAFSNVIKYQEWKHPNAWINFLLQ